MNNLELLKEMISDYNTEMLLAIRASVDYDEQGESKYRHGAYVLAPFIKQIAIALGLEIERFDKEVEFLNDDYDNVKRNVPQLKISQR